MPARSRLPPTVASNAVCTAFLTVKDAADYLGFSPHTLYVWRHRRQGPPSFRMGPRGRVMYRLDVLVATRSGDPSTIERIEQRLRRHILPHLGPQPLSGAGPETLRNWKKRLGKDLGPTSIRLVWATLSSVLQGAVEGRRLARNPCRSSTVGPTAAAPGRVGAWSPEGVLAVRAAFAKEVVHVRRQVKMVRAKLCSALPKGRKVRDVPLPSSVARAVQRHLELFPPVGCERHRSAVGNGKGARVWEPSREHGFHALRHFHASEDWRPANRSSPWHAGWDTPTPGSHFLPRAGARGSAAIDDAILA